MGLQHVAGHRRHRRLIVSLLALALGATLGVAAPQAFAGAKDEQRRYTAELYLESFYRSARPHARVEVSGLVVPVEVVGEYVTLMVQRRSGGNWTKVSRARVQVGFTPPTSWKGKFNSWFNVEGYQTGTNQKWDGQVLFGSPQTNLVFHYVDYTMTSSLGSLTSYGNTLDGGTYDYLGRVVPVMEYGTLRWYFAAFKLDNVPGDSYKGENYHQTSGVWSTTDARGVTTEVDGVMLDSESLMWGSGETRPLLNGDQHMRASLVRPLPPSFPGLTGTWVSDWDLAPSGRVTPYGHRAGDYHWTTSFAKKGVYRVQAKIAKTRDHGALQSKWERITVR